MSRSTSALTAAVLAASVSCADTSGEHLQLKLSATGSPAQEVPILGGSITLRSAALAIGPLYLCAAQSAERELCETAQAEWLEVATVDALNPTEQELGQLTAVSGSVRSGELDYGISWLSAQSAPRASSGALDGHSALLLASARGDDGTELVLEALIDVAPSARVGSAAQQRSEEQLLQRGDRLILRVDPNLWLSGIHFDALQSLDADDADGHVRIEPGSQAYEAIVQSMTNDGVPSFAWER